MGRQTRRGRREGGVAAAASKRCKRRRCIARFAVLRNAQRICAQRGPRSVCATCLQGQQVNASLQLQISFYCCSSSFDLVRHQLRNLFSFTIQMENMRGKRGEREGMQGEGCGRTEAAISNWQLATLLIYQAATTTTSHMATCNRSATGDSAAHINIYIKHNIA